MHSREIVFKLNNLLHVSTNHVAIFREVIQRMEVSTLCITSLKKLHESPKRIGA